MANAKDRFVEWLTELLMRFRLTGLGDRLRRYGLKGRSPGAAALNPVEVVVPLTSGLTFNPRIKGFAVPFDPRLHPALPGIQEQAMHAIFARYRIKWIPPEYLRWLGLAPDPFEAFERFVEDFGLEYKLLRGLKADRREVAKLEQAIGILLELGQMPELSDDLKMEVRHQLRERQYGVAEQMITVAQTVFRIVRDAQTVGQRIVFPFYVVGLLDPLSGFLTNPFKLAANDAAEAQQLQNMFVALQDRFDDLVKLYEEQISFMAQNWPADPNDPWALANVDLRDGYILSYDDNVKALRTSELDIDQIAEAINNLDMVLQSLYDFIAELQANGAPGFNAPPPSAALETWNQWVEMAKRLGFSESDNPDKAQIKSRYRRAAMLYHPDRHAQAPKAEQKTAEEMFKQVAEAYDILNKGKPANPAAQAAA